MTHRIHGASIYAKIKGIYWWDPWSTIYSSTMDPMGNGYLVAHHTNPKEVISLFIRSGKSRVDPPITRLITYLPAPGFKALASGVQDTSLGPLSRPPRGWRLRRHGGSPGRTLAVSQGTKALRRRSNRCQIPGTWASKGPPKRWVGERVPDGWNHVPSLP